MNNENNNFNQNMNNGQVNPTQQQFNSTVQPQQQMNNFQSSEVNNVQQPIAQPNIQPQYEKIQSRKTNKNALISLACSIVSLFVFGWLSFVGLGLAIRALKEIKTSGEKGKVLAIISIILAVVCAILYFSQMVPR